MWDCARPLVVKRHKMKPAKVGRATDIQRATTTTQRRRRRRRRRREDDDAYDDRDYNVGEDEMLARGDRRWPWQWRWMWVMTVWNE